MNNNISTESAEHSLSRGENSLQRTEMLQIKGMLDRFEEKVMSRLDKLETRV